MSPQRIGTAQLTSAPTRAGNVLDRRTAARLLSAQREKFLQSLEVSKNDWGAFSFLARAALAALRKEVFSTGQTSVLLPLETWATIANSRSRGGQVKPHSLKPVFTEHAGTYPATAVKESVEITLEVVTPGIRGKKDRAGLYGFRVAFTKGNHALNVEETGGPSSVSRWVEKAASRAQLKAEEEKILSEAKVRLLRIGSPLAARLTLFAKRNGRNISPMLALILAALIAVSAVASTTAVIYVAYRAVKEMTREQHQRQRPTGSRAHSEITVSPYDEPRIVELTKWDTPVDAPSPATTPPADVQRDKKGRVVRAKDGTPLLVFNFNPRDDADVTNPDHRHPGTIDASVAQQGVAMLIQPTSPEREFCVVDFGDTWPKQDGYTVVGELVVSAPWTLADIERPPHQFVVSAWIYEGDKADPRRLREVIRKAITFPSARTSSPQLP